MVGCVDGEGIGLVRQTTELEFEIGRVVVGDGVVFESVARGLALGVVDARFGVVALRFRCGFVDVVSQIKSVAVADCDCGRICESVCIQRDCRAADHVVAEFARVLDTLEREEFFDVFGRGARQRRGVVREGVARSLAGCIVSCRAALESCRIARIFGRCEVEISELGTGDCVGGVGGSFLREDPLQIQRDDAVCFGDHSLICSSDCRVQSFGHAAQVRHGEGVRVVFRRVVVIVARDFVAAGCRCEVSVGVSTLVVDGRPVGRECRSVLFVFRQLRAFGDNQVVVVSAAVEDDTAIDECAFLQRDGGAFDLDCSAEAVGVEVFCQAFDGERRRFGRRVIGEAVRRRRVVSLVVGGSVGVGVDLAPVRDFEGRSRFRRTILRGDSRAVVGDRQRVVGRVVAAENDIERAALRQVEHVGRQRDSPLAVVAFHRFGQGHVRFHAADCEGVAVRLRLRCEGEGCGIGGFRFRPVLGNGVGRLVSCNVVSDCLVPRGGRCGCCFNGCNVADRQLVSVRAFVGERDGRCACLCDVEVGFGQSDCAACGFDRAEVCVCRYAADREQIRNVTCNGGLIGVGIRCALGRSPVRFVSRRRLILDAVVGDSAERVSGGVDSLCGEQSVIAGAAQNERVARGRAVRQSNRAGFRRKVCLRDGDGVLAVACNRCDVRRVVDAAETEESIVDLFGVGVARGAARFGRSDPRFGIGDIVERAVNFFSRESLSRLRLRSCDVAEAEAVVAHVVAGDRNGRGGVRLVDDIFQNREDVLLARFVVSGNDSCRACNQTADRQSHRSLLILRVVRVGVVGLRPVSGRSVGSGEGRFAVGACRRACRECNFIGGRRTAVSLDVGDVQIQGVRTTCDIRNFDFEAAAVFDGAQSVVIDRDVVASDVVAALNFGYSHEIRFAFFDLRDARECEEIRSICCRRVFDCVGCV